MTNSTVPKSLSKIVEALPDEWWLAGLDASAPDQARAVRAVREGRAATKRLSAPVAARLVAELTGPALAVALEGERRVSVLAAAGSTAQHEEPEHAPVPPKVPAVFRGELTAVRARLGARQNRLRVGTAVAGLSARSAEEAEALLADVMAVVAQGEWGELLVAAVRAEIPVRPERVLALGLALSGARSWWVEQAWWSLGGDGRVVEGEVVVGLARVCAEAGVALPCAPAVSAWRDAVCAAALTWEDEVRWRCVAALARAGCGAEQMLGLCAHMSWEGRLDVGLSCAEREAAVALLCAAGTDEIAQTPRRECFSVVARVGDRLGVEQLAGLYQRAARAERGSFGWRAVTVVLGGSSHSPATATVRDALGRCGEDVLGVVRAELAEVLNGRSAGWAGRWNTTLSLGESLEGELAEAVLEASGMLGSWRVLYASAARHQAAQVVLARGVVACFEAHDLCEEGAGMFLSMLDAWEGSLDELAGSVALLTGGG